MLPVDLVGSIRRGLQGYGRTHEKKLYCSSDILGPLRHAQLRLAGAPSAEEGLVNLIRLETGTMWHDRILKYLADDGLAVMGEVRLSPWLPEGWGGRADWLFWDFENRCFVVGDLKTTKGSGMYYIERDGAKSDHVHQLSAYYHALVAAKMPVKRRVFVCYLPMDADGAGLIEEVEPTIVEFEPLDKNYLWPLMEEKWAKCQEYLFNAELPCLHPSTEQLLLGLAPPTPRTHKLFKDKTNNRIDVKLVPDWRTRFCPYPNELCDCSEQGSTKIGHYVMDETNGIQYVPRKGYENVIPLLAPTVADFGNRRAA